MIIGIGCNCVNTGSGQILIRSLAAGLPVWPSGHPRKSVYRQKCHILQRIFGNLETVATRSSTLPHTCFFGK